MNAHSSGAPVDTGTRVIYSEQLRLPWYWWLAAGTLAVLLSVTMSFNRPVIYPVATFVVVLAFLAWAIIWGSRHRVEVTEDSTGRRHLQAGGASLPAAVVDRTLVVPPTAKQAALGRQLDPAAFLATHSWLPSMAMIVLNDPADPTPYWLVSARNPQALLDAFLGTSS